VQPINNNNNNNNNQNTLVSHVVDAIPGNNSFTLQSAESMAGGEVKVTVDLHQPLSLVPPVTAPLAVIDPEETSVGSNLSKAPGRKKRKTAVAEEVEATDKPVSKRAKKLPIIKEEQEIAQVDEPKVHLAPHQSMLSNQPTDILLAASDEILFVNVDQGNQPTTSSSSRHSASTLQRNRKAGSSLFLESWDDDEEVGSLHSEMQNQRAVGAITNRSLANRKRKVLNITGDDSELPPVSQDMKLKKNEKQLSSSSAFLDDDHQWDEKDVSVGDKKKKKKFDLEDNQQSLLDKDIEKKEEVESTTTSSRSRRIINKISSNNSSNSSSNKTMDAFFVKTNDPSNAVTDNASTTIPPGVSNTKVMGVKPEISRARPAQVKEKTRDVKDHDQDDLEMWVTVERGVGRIQLANSTSTQKAHKPKAEFVQVGKEWRGLDDNYQRRLVEDHKMELQQQPASLSVGSGLARDTDDAVVYIPPVIIEKIFVLKDERLSQLGNGQQMSTSLPSTTSSNSGSHQENSGLVRNVKRFQKNIVRSVTSNDQVSLRTMQRVLPKETEREIQVRPLIRSPTINSENN
jgi:hypothetical protein